MEKARSGYDLLLRLEKCSPDDIDTWNELMQKWTATNAEIVLNELEKRLSLIKELSALVESSKTDELHDLQPLFERGLWMFGTEYEAVDFRSNRGLATIVRDFLGGTDKELARRRPDFVCLPDCSIGVYGAFAYGIEGEISGVRKVLIVELKKGGFTLKQKELDQARDYAKELRKAADVRQDTNIIGYVLGADAEQSLEKLSHGEHTTIYPMIYRTLLDRAHSRTFNLQRRIQETQPSLFVDPEVEEVLASPVQQDYINELS
jgi:plasmid stabilization system protein ParE